MEIGNLGEAIAFRVSDDELLPFQQLGRTKTARWAKHQPLEGKSALEFQGMDNDSITMNVTVIASLGVRPQDVLDDIQSAQARGAVLPLVIGGVGYGYFVIQGVKESGHNFLPEGGLYQVTVALTLLEYA